jgi:hypothetical protein
VRHGSLLFFVLPDRRFCHAILYLAVPVRADGDVFGVTVRPDGNERGDAPWPRYADVDSYP